MLTRMKYELGLSCCYTLHTYTNKKSKSLSTSVCTWEAVLHGRNRRVMSKEGGESSGLPRADAATSSAKRAATDVESDSVKRRCDWMGAGGDGLRQKPMKRADALRKEEVKQSISSIKSKLSAPKTSGVAREDKRKQKIGSFSAGLTKDQIRASQQQHKEKMEAWGKPIPTCALPPFPPISRQVPSNVS